MTARVAPDNHPSTLPESDPHRASRSQYPRMITSSPSSRNFRVSPVGRVSGSAPRQVSSSRQPRDSFAGPEMVPAGEQVAGLKVAAVAGVVGQHLRQGPVEVGRAGRGSAAAEPGRSAAHPRLDERYTSTVTSTAARFGVPPRVEIGERGRVAGRPRRTPARGTAPAPRASPPRARSWWRSSSPGTGRAAGTPRSGGRARTSR